MTGRKLTRVLGLSLLVLAPACSAATHERTAVEPAVMLPGDRRVEHPVHSADLSVAMADLEKLTFEDLPPVIESEAVRVARLGEIERIADTIASSAAALPGFLDSVELPAASAARFRELAEQLRIDAQWLRDRAQTGEIESVRDEREVLLATCNACHGEFRSFTRR